MKRTPLYDRHVSAGAKMVDFAGWEMPVQFSGIKEETAAVRQRSGLFDVSHMGEITVSGAASPDFLDWVLSRPVSGYSPDQVIYALLSQEDGGTVDDLMVYPENQTAFLLVVNAANKEKDLAHLRRSLDLFTAKQPAAADIRIDDVSDQYGLLAIQGPESLQMLLAAADQLALSKADQARISGLKRFRQLRLAHPAGELILSRTGYTGEDGYELYLPAEETPRFWDAFLAAGTTPCGLGARDALRLEAGLPLYGHELSEHITALEGGMGRFVDLGRDFQGQKMAERTQRRLIGLKSLGRGIAREAYPVWHEGRQIGQITSGSFSPTLNAGIALALVPADFPEQVETVEVEIRNKRHPFAVVSPPFV